MALIKTNPNLIRLVNLLADGQYHIGSDLATELGITKVSVWKKIKQLKGYGIQLESVKGKGYRLNQPLRLLDAHQLKTLLTTQLSIIEKLTILSSVDSTNIYLKNRLAQQRLPISICLAEQQTAGQGRLGRPWFSPFGANIYLSLSWKTPQDSNKLNGLSLAIGVAAMKALEELGLREDVGIKWPNDIYYRHQKLAGILVELIANRHSHTQVVIGIGMNVNMLNQAKAPIDKDWTSIQHITQEYQDRNILVGILIKAILAELENIQQHSLATRLAQWKRYDILYGKAITLAYQGKEVHGIAKGINEQGHLLLLTADGIWLSCSSGETSIKQFSV